MRRFTLLLALAATLALLTFADTASAYYNPTVGRWVSRDPIEYGDGANLYNYSGCSPATTRDPSGQYSKEEFRTLPPPGWSNKPLRQWPPLAQRCPNGSGDQCENLTISFYWAGRFNPGAPADRSFFSHTANAGTYIGVENVLQLISSLDKRVGQCQCVETLSILAHGGTRGSGGFRFAQGWKTQGERDSYVTDIAPEGQSPDYSNVTAFGRIIKGVMCPKPKRCQINLMACHSADGQTASILARETGCDVVGTTGNTGFYRDGTWEMDGPLTEVNGIVGSPDLVTYHPDRDPTRRQQSSGQGLFGASSGQTWHPPEPGRRMPGQMTAQAW